MIHGILMIEGMDLYLLPWIHCGIDEKKLF